MDELMLVKKSTMDAIADAARDVSGATVKMFPEQMPSYIRIGGGSSSASTDIPEDVVNEALRVSSGMLSKMGQNSLTFVAMSDSHEMGDNDHTLDYIIERYRRANKNAGQAAKLVSDAVHLDFFAHLGDFVWASSSTTVHDGVQSIRQMLGYINDVVDDNESFLTPGNHDSLQSSYSATGERLSYGVLSGLIGTYRYKDFESKKVRVICLNTADNSKTPAATATVGASQLQWFANALDLSAKADADQWSVIILSHHPLDHGDVKYAANFLAAYLEGTSYSCTVESTTVSYDYSGKNAAKVIAQFHGHIHNFLVDYVHDLRTGTAVPTTVKRIAIPNSCFGRQNEYAKNSGPESNGIEYGEFDESGNVVVYDKDDDGADGDITAFCLVSIDLDKQVIYADCFGAGPDRIISYATEDVVVYSVTNNLTNAKNSNGSTTIVDGSPYSATISALVGYELDTITVSMGGTNITSTAVSGSNITISSVTGDIVITATAVEVDTFEYGDFTNLVPLSQERDSTAVYNGIGYKNGVYASEEGNGDGSDSSCVATGWIPFTWDSTNSLYVKGAAVTTASHVRFYGYSTKAGSPVNNAYAIGSRLDEFFVVEELGTNYYKLTPKSNVAAVEYIRMSLVGTGENLIVTINEPIHASADDGGDSGDTGTYTNLVPTSVATDGVTVFNGVGYKDGAYASAPHTGTDSACVTTGFIRLPSGTKDIYVKGATWDASNEHCRMHVYSSLGSSAGLSQNIKAPSVNPDLLTITELGTDYYRFTINDDEHMTNKWYCMSLVGTGENLIITHDEPIE